jgi:ABC-type spermidine/putrescine transport system permease subunit II
LEEQAMIGDAGRCRTMTRFTFPLCLPGFLSGGIFAFALVRSEFF